MESDDLRAVDRPARIIAYALMCADIRRNGAAWPYDCVQAGQIAVLALQFAGILPAPGSSAPAGASTSP